MLSLHETVSNIIALEATGVTSYLNMFLIHLMLSIH